MSFSELLGNSQLKNNLQSAVAQDKLAHFYLISGAEGSGKHTLARLLAAAMMCRETDKPCMRCAQCRKVLSGNHPDFITVDDPEKKTVPVELIRNARAELFIRPNEGRRKVYLFPRAQDIGLPGQNALLKVLEEPPAYGVFLLLTDNPEKLLPTVRSRCTELKLHPLEDDVLRSALEQAFPAADDETIRSAMLRGGGYLGQAKDILAGGNRLLPQTERFAAACAGKDRLEMLRLLCSMEKTKREPLIQILSQWRELLHDSLTCRAGLPAPSPMAQSLGTARSARDLMRAAEEIDKVLEYAQGNVSPAAICGYLARTLQ